MKKSEFKEYQKLTFAKIQKMSKETSREIILEIAKASAEGKKNSNKIKDDKKKLAWLETLLSQRILEGTK